MASISEESPAYGVWVGILSIVICLLGAVVIIATDGAGTVEADDGTGVASIGPVVVEDPVVHGRKIFAQSCFFCHGEEGKGGVENENYIKGTVPALNEMADKFFLYEKEDAQTVIDFLKKKSLGGLTAVEKKEIPGVNRVLAQYDAVRKVILNGNPAGKKDPNGPVPPLQMPAWKANLTGKDIDHVLAYLLTLQPWEEEEEDEEEDE